MLRISCLRCMANVCYIVSIWSKQRQQPQFCWRMAWWYDSGKHPSIHSFNAYVLLHLLMGIFLLYFIIHSQADPSNSKLHLDLAFRFMFLTITCSVHTIQVFRFVYSFLVSMWCDGRRKKWFRNIWEHIIRWNFRQMAQQFNKDLFLFVIRVAIR